MRRVVEGKVDDPKTEESGNAVPVIQVLRNRLDTCRERNGEPSDGWMFPSERGTPMNPNNALNREILPALNRCAVCGTSEMEHDGEDHEYRRDASIPEWKGWHAFRRGLGSNLHRLGTDDKTIQAILRHSDVSTTQASYIIKSPEDVKRAMADLQKRYSK